MPDEGDRSGLGVLEAAEGVGEPDDPCSPCSVLSCHAAPWRTTVGVQARQGLCRDDP